MLGRCQVTHAPNAGALRLCCRVHRNRGLRRGRAPREKPGRWPRGLVPVARLLKMRISPCPPADTNFASKRTVPHARCLRFTHSSNGCIASGLARLPWTAARRVTRTKRNCSDLASVTWASSRSPLSRPGCWHAPVACTRSLYLPSTIASVWNQTVAGQNKSGTGIIWEEKSRFAVDNVRARDKKFIELGAKRRVAFAREHLEAAPIDDRHLASPAADQSDFLK